MKNRKSTAETGNKTPIEVVLFDLIHIGRFCIMEYSPEEYTRYYIVQALFKLMSEYEYDKINVSDIARKAGVGRATFYRYFKNKEDVIVFYFEHNAKEFQISQRFLPRCKEDYIEIATLVFTLFKKNKESIKLLKNAHLEGLYLDYLNNNFVKLFENDNETTNHYQAYLYAGMLFNVSMAWLEKDCEGSIANLANTVINAIM